MNNTYGVLMNAKTMWIFRVCINDKVYSADRRSDYGWFSFDIEPSYIWCRTKKHMEEIL